MVKWGRDRIGVVLTGDCNVERRGGGVRVEMGEKAEMGEEGREIFNTSWMLSSQCRVGNSDCSGS